MKRCLGIWWVVMVLVGLLGAGETAHAQRRGGLPEKSIGIGPAIQAGGYLDDRDYRGFRDYRRDYVHLRGTVGFHLHWDKFVLQRRKGSKVTLGLSLGVLGQVLAWEPETFHDRSLLLDAAFRTRFVVGIREFALYAGPAIGPTLLSVLNRDYGANERARPGVMFNFVALGFEWWWNPKHSLFVEVGWVAHWLYHDAWDVRMGQASIALGVNFGR